MYKSLHNHTTFSFLDGYGTPEQIAVRLRELGQDCCAVTDHGNVFAHVPWYKTLHQHGLKPLLGCEFYITDDLTSREKGARSVGADSYPHVTVLAQDSMGYRNLLRLSRLSYETGFYHKPRIDWPTLARFSEGLVVLSGCLGGYPSRILLEQGIDACAKFLAEQSRNIENFFVEIIPEPGLPGLLSEQVTPQLVTVAQALKLPMVITSDAHFPRPEDHEVEDLMVCVGIGKSVYDPTRTLKLPDYQFYCSEQQLRDRLKRVDPNLNPRVVDAMFQNTVLIADTCQVELPKASSVKFPGANLSGGSEQMLQNKLHDALAKKKFDQQTWGQYCLRMTHEYETVRRKGFCDYILAVADVIAHMKQQGHLVVCRGSAAGSLMLWLLGASQIDPIKHGLSFERFYDDNRPDPPDVDIDFPRTAREAAIQYVYSKYGAANCSQIAALSKMGWKQALQDAARAYVIPRGEYAALSSVVETWDEDERGDAIDSIAAETVLKKYPQLQIIKRMVGQYRQSSVHAAGVLIANEPLEDMIGIVLGAMKQPIAAVDKHGAAYMGFLKMDFLSVNALDIISEVLRLIQLPITWLESLEFDDAATFETARNGYLSGIFQLDGQAAARVAADIRIDTFEDLVAASALCRPGPAEWVETYKRNKDKPHDFERYLGMLHPLAAATVRETYGIMLYQEQVMALARNMGEFEWTDVHKLRKLVSATGRELLDQYELAFKQGAANQGVSPAEQDFWWNSIRTHGGYSFNKSHCVTYGMVGYWMLYLKTHYPAQFYEAYLRHETDDLLIKRLIREFTALGGKVELLCPAKSQRSFSAKGPNTLVGGYSNLNGMGPVYTNKIMEHAPFEHWEDLIAKLPTRVADRLVRSGIMTGDWDPQIAIELAPWLPVVRTLPAHAAVRDRSGVATLDALHTGETLVGDAFVAGYVTAKNFSHEKIIFVIEDEFNAVRCRVSARMLPQVGDKFRQLLEGDYVAVSGWWTGETLYCKDYVLIDRRTEEKRIVKRASTKQKRSKKDDRPDVLSADVIATLGGLS